jgi:hypothetical protein
VRGEKGRTSDNPEVGQEIGLKQFREISQEELDIIADELANSKRYLDDASGLIAELTRREYSTMQTIYVVSKVTGCGLEAAKKLVLDQTGAVPVSLMMPKSSSWKMVSPKTNYPDDIEDTELGEVFISLRIDCAFTDHDFVTKGMALSDEEAERVLPKLSMRLKKIETGLGPQKEGWSLRLYHEKDVAAGAAMEYGIKLS